MFMMDDAYIEARTFMLLSAMGSNVVPKVIQPGESVPFATTDDFDAAHADEELLKATLRGKANTEAITLYESVRTRLRTPLLRQASAEDVKSYFG